MHYNYVIQTRKFISQKLPVYKIGKTEQELTSSGRNKRMNGYPKDNIQLALFAVSNCHEAEKLLIKNLNLSDDIKVIGIGNEWFEGNIDTISQIALSSALAFKPIHLEEVKVIDPIILSPLQCVYCLKEFGNNSNLRRHTRTCKEIQDVVRCLEIQLLLDIELTPGNECRFCNKYFSKNGHLTRHLKICKAKKEYK